MLGWDFQRKHRKIIFEYGGHLLEVVMRNTGTCYAIGTANMAEPTLFPNITSIFKLYTKYRCFSQKKVIDMQINKHLSNKIIETSIPPWRGRNRRC